MFYLVTKAWHVSRNYFMKSKDCIVKLRLLSNKACLLKAFCGA